MKGYLFTKTHEPLVLIEKPDPVAGPGQVVVDIKAIGLCLTDIHMLEQEYYMYIATGAPCIIGHECAGVVASVGEGVTNVKVGDRVAIENTVNNDTHECIGFTQDGGYADKILVNDYQCVHMPDSVTMPEAASSTCAGRTAYHALFANGGAKAGTKVGVIGVGGIGQYVVGMAAAAGCQVYAATRNPKAQQMARDLGAVRVESSITAYADEKLDVIIDCAGARKTINDAIHTVKFAGTVVLVGMMETDIVIENASALDSLILKEVRLVGNLGGSSPDIEGIFELIDADKYHPQLSTISFDEILDGVEQLRAGKVDGKLVALVD